MPPRSSSCWISARSPAWLPRTWCSRRRAEAPTPVCSPAARLPLTPAVTCPTSWRSGLPRGSTSDDPMWRGSPTRRSRSCDRRRSWPTRMSRSTPLDRRRLRGADGGGRRRDPMGRPARWLAARPHLFGQGVFGSARPGRRRSLRFRCRLHPHRRLAGTVRSRRRPRLSAATNDVCVQIRVTRPTWNATRTWGVRPRVALRG
jgi:hypothetical protein